MIAGNEKGDSWINIIWTDKLRRLYVLQLCIRISIEIVFFYFYYLIQTQQHPATTEVRKSIKLSSHYLSLKFLSIWHVPHTYICQHGLLPDSPCMTDETISCYVPRYQEKTFVLWYMVFFTGALIG